VKFEVGQSPGAKERRLVLRYAGVSLIGFVADATVLHLFIELGMAPAWARLISLAFAMHVTFVLNGLHVFRQLDRKRLPRQWGGYMATNAFGNFCNYWIFVTLVSTHWRVIANPLFALAVGSFTAWVMNFAATRYVVFRRVAEERTLKPAP
jgi:putative flippase GtrA